MKWFSFNFICANKNPHNCVDISIAYYNDRFIMLWKPYKLVPCFMQVPGVRTILEQQLAAPQILNKAYYDCTKPMSHGNLSCELNAISFWKITLPDVTAVRSAILKRGNGESMEERGISGNTREYHIKGNRNISGNIMILWTILRLLHYQMNLINIFLKIAMLNIITIAVTEFHLIDYLLKLVHSSNAPFYL